MSERLTDRNGKYLGLWKSKSHWKTTAVVDTNFLVNVKTLPMLGVDFFEALQMTIDYRKKLFNGPRPSRHPDTKKKQGGIFKDAEWY